MIGLILAAVESEPSSLTKTQVLYAVLAVIGGLYTTARAIVFLTPTKRDDETLKKVDRWLAIFKTVTGLSLNQGIKKHSPK